MYVILILTVFVATAGVFFTVYTLSYNAMVYDMRERAIGIKYHILDNFYAEDFVDIGGDSPQAHATTQHVQNIFDEVRNLSNLSSLYVARLDGSGGIITTLGADFAPTSEIEADLRFSLEQGLVIIGEGIYRTPGGGVFTIFWPFYDHYGMLLGAVGMEFNADIIADSHTQAALYSLVLSAALLALISIVAYVSMSRVTESTYKKLAYTDILTGFENRMAFEHRLRECGDLAEQGRSVTMIICDINNLKVVNDTLGHEAGDAYIKNTANLIAENIGRNIPLYRIGGDEIASILIDKKEAELERIMQKLQDEQRPAFKKHLFSCACGRASFDPSLDESLRGTFKRADEAMYAAKIRQKGLANVR